MKIAKKNIFDTIFRFFVHGCVSFTDPLILKIEISVICDPHSTEIFRKYCKNTPWKYCKIAKIFWNLSLMLLKYCNNLATTAQNMMYAIFSKYCQN